MALDHTEDSSTQLAKLAQVTNERDMLNEKLKVAGKALNEAIKLVLEARKTGEKDKIIDAQIEAQEFKGKFAEIKADIKSCQDIIATLKYLIKMEKY